MSEPEINGGLPGADIVTPCGATTFVPALNVTVICELAHGHDGHHHGHIGIVTPPGSRSPHESFPQAYDWLDEETL